MNHLPRKKPPIAGCLIVFFAGLGSWVAILWLCGLL